MKPKVIVQVRCASNQSQRDSFEQELRTKLDADVAVLDCQDMEVSMVGTPYTFEERLGDYSRKTGVQTMDDLAEVIGWYTENKLR